MSSFSAQDSHDQLLSSLESQHIPLGQASDKLLNGKDTHHTITKFNSQDSQTKLIEDITQQKSTLVGGQRIQLQERPPLWQASRDVIGDGHIPQVEVRYTNTHTCWPPPIFIPSICALECLMFLYYCLAYDQQGDSWPVPDDSALQFDPFHRKQIWRYFTVMLVHIGYMHLISNVSVTLIVGIPLEMLHGPWRVALIYVGSVLAGSLTGSIIMPNEFFVGASGGVFGVMGANLANFILNWTLLQQNKRCFVALIIANCVTFIFMTIYAVILNVPEFQNVVHTVHMMGWTAGLILSLTLLRCFGKHRFYTILRRMALVVFIILLVTSLILEISIYRESLPVPKEETNSTSVEEVIMLLLKIRNNTGPRTNPCGTPLVALNASDADSLISTLRWCRNDFIHTRV